MQAMWPARRSLASRLQSSGCTPVTNLSFVTNKQLFHDRDSHEHDSGLQVAVRLRVLGCTGKSLSCLEMIPCVRPPHNVSYQRTTCSQPSEPMLAGQAAYRVHEYRIGLRSANSILLSLAGRSVCLLAECTVRRSS